MSQETAVPKIELIPVALIEVVNPRIRNRKAFKEIIANIAAVGLKKPITVSLTRSADGNRYNLVCGQGRLEAFLALGQTKIPAIVVAADDEDCQVMSLVENCARRQHRAIDLLRDIQGLKQRGYSLTETAHKTGLTVEYVRRVTRLLDGNEHRLLRAVESGQIPLSVAVDIAEAEDSEVQEALQQAYERKQLRGNRLLVARRIIEQRRKRGKGLRGSANNKERRPVSSGDLVRAYRESADKKRLLVQKAEVTRDRLVFASEALKKLFSDENLLTLLRAEQLDTLPRNLAERLHIAAEA